MDCSPETHELLNELLALCESALPETLEAVYLHGSLASGDFDGDVSDLDLLVVVSEDVVDSQLQSLRKLHRGFAERYPAWDDRVDASYLSSEALRTCKERESSIVVISPGEAINRQRTTPGWVMNWYAVREHGITLLGPPPEAIIAPISIEEFLNAVRAHMREMPRRTKASREPTFHVYAVLTACRALYACSRRKQSSKASAARWAMEVFPDRRAVVATALALRNRQTEAVEWAEFAVAAEQFVRFAAREVSES